MQQNTSKTSIKGAPQFVAFAIACTLRWAGLGAQAHSQKAHPQPPTCTHTPRCICKQALTLDCLPKGTGRHGGRVPQRAHPQAGLQPPPQPHPVGLLPPSPPPSSQPCCLAPAACYHDVHDDGYHDDHDDGYHDDHDDGYHDDHDDGYHDDHDDGYHDDHDDGYHDDHDDGYDDGHVEVDAAGSVDGLPCEPPGPRCGCGPPR
eukprot:1161617-Pelagomonas_calceolata.AAC.9